MKPNLTRVFKTLASLFHLFCLGLIVISIAILFINSNFGRGITWIQSETYVQSNLFYNQLQSDITAIFDYARLRDAFETDGELDMDRVILTIDYGPNESIDYTLADVIELGESYGYFLEDDWSIRVIASDMDFIEEEPLLVEYKSYDPEPVFTEPGQAYSKMKDLCYETLNHFSRYCYVYHNMILAPSNLSFQLTCDNENNMLPGDLMVYTNTASPSWEKLKHMGLYAEYSIDELHVETNMMQVPNYIQDLVSNTQFYEQSFRHFIISVDTNFPHVDVYTREASNYENMRKWTIYGLILLGAGIIGCLFSLLYLMLVSGYNSKDHSHVSLCSFDQMRAESCVLMFFLLGAFLCYVMRMIGFRIIHLVVSQSSWYFAELLATWIVIYLTALLCFFSLLRRYKAGTLWEKSWTRKALLEIQDYFTQDHSSHSTAYFYLAFLLLNIGFTGGVIYLFFTMDTLRLQLIFCALIILWCLMDLICFYFIIKKTNQNMKISQAVANIASGDISYCVNVEEFSGKQKITADHINHIGKNLDFALQEKVKSERFKADLITNVSHDLKTPLTSIINYVDLIKREQVQNERIQGYLEILEQKSQRLKTLTEDLVEASKASSGNLKLEISDIDFVELINQTNGEFEEKFALRNLELISHLPPAPILIEADGRRLWRVLENLYNNAFKYAMEHSRIYVDIVQDQDMVTFTIKNISQHPLNISSSELTERFVRGDVSRTTEGSGLGLSIAQSLTQLQKGIFEIVIDGDLFKVYVKFPVKKDVNSGNPSQDVLE